MATSPPSYSPTAAPPLDVTAVDEDFSEADISNMLKDSDKVMQRLNESRSELLSRVEDLKQDLQHWRGKLDTEVSSYNEDIVDLKISLSSDVEQLKSEFQELQDSLKEQLAATTSKLAELDTSVAGCAQFFEGIHANCELEMTFFDDLTADLGLEGRESSEFFYYSNSDAPVSTVTIEEVLE